MVDMLRDAALWGSVPGAFDDIAARHGAVAIGANDWDDSELCDGEAYIADTPRSSSRYQTIWLSGDRRARPVGTEAGRLIAEHLELQRIIQWSWREEPHPVIIDDLGIIALPAPLPFTVEAAAEIITDASEEAWGHGTLHVPLPLDEDQARRLVRTLDGRLHANVCITPLTSRTGRASSSRASSGTAAGTQDPGVRRVISRKPA